MKVTVSYALPHVHWFRELELASPSTVAVALAESGIFEAFPHLRPLPDGVGVNGQRVVPETALTDHDRVELYRPLTFDPMVSRRRRAAHKAKRALG